MIPTSCGVAGVADRGVSEADSRTNPANQTHMPVKDKRSPNRLQTNISLVDVVSHFVRRPDRRPRPCADVEHPPARSKTEELP